MRLGQRVLGCLLAALAGAALVAISDVELEAEDPRDALLRLSWRAIGRRIEQCRAPTASELEALPLHMRPSEICEGELAPFDLAVRLDGELLIDRELRPAGAREDRPIYVFEEIRVPPGRHSLEVSFAQATRGEAEADPPLRLATTRVLSARRTLLVTRSSETGELVLVESTPGAGDPGGS